MRYKARPLSSTAMSYGYHIDGVEQWPTIVATYPVAAEALLDFSSGRNRIGRRPYQPCNHVHVNVAPGTKPPYIEDGWFSDPVIHTFDGHIWNYVPNHMIHYMDSTVGAIDDVAVPSNVAGKAVRDAFDYALDAIPDSVSIANFLWELREVKQLVPKLQSLALAPGQLLLWWQFAVRPLVDDVIKLLNLVENVNKRLEHLRRINQRTVTLRHHAHWAEDVNGETVVVWNGSSGFGLPEVVETLPVWHAGTVSIALTVKTDLDLGGADVFTIAMMAALGLNNPIKAAWNAIPFSWLLEWFVNLDNFLDTFEIPEFTGTINVVGASHTVKTRSMFGHYGYTKPFELGHLPYPWMGRSELQRFGTTLLRGFRRRSGLPPGEVSFEGLSLTQQAILAALLQQQGVVRNRSRR